MSQNTLLSDAVFTGFESVRIEEFVLATFINFPNTYYTHAENLNEKDFNNPVNKLIYHAVRHLGTNSKIDIGTVLEKLKEGNSDKTIEKIERKDYDQVVLDICEQISTPEHLVEHLKKLKDYSMRRGIKTMCNSSLEMLSEYKEPNEILESITQSILDVQTINNDEEYSIENSVGQVLESFNDDSNIDYQKSYIESLDEFMYGWEPSDLVIIAAAPSMGKTSLMLEIVKNKVLRGEPVALFSLEMNDTQLLKRMIAVESCVELTKLRNKSLLLPEDYNEIHSVASKMMKAPLFIDDKTGKLHIILSKIRKYVIRHQVKFVAIDYLQLMQANVGKNGNREQEISHISRSLKELARELKIVIVALSQINRGIHARANKRPNLGDLRESGAIEQDADMVIFVHRELYFDLERLAHTDVENVELIVAKGRSTGTSVIHTKFVTKLTKFINENEIKFNAKLQNLKDNSGSF